MFKLLLEMAKNYIRKVVYSQKPISSYEIPEYHYNKDVSVVKYEKPNTEEIRTIDVSMYEEQDEITHIITKENTVWSSEKFAVSKNLSCTKWHYERISDNTDIVAQKDGDYIKLTGTFKGKEQRKTYKIGDGLWYQMMDMAMPAFIASDEEEIVFYSIGTGNNRGAMELGEFSAKKVGEEKVKVNGIEYDCIKITFVLTAFSWAWTGFYWYDKKTGQLVQTSEKGKMQAS